MPKSIACVIVLFCVFVAPTRAASATEVTGDTPVAADTSLPWENDARFVQSKKEMEEYDEDVRRALLLASDPRGWIVASTFLFSNGNHPRDPALIQKAADAAQNDAFVQMMVTKLATSSSTEWSAAQKRLEKLEPENGTVWFNALNAASQSANAAAVDDALDRFSKSVRFDSYYITLAKEMVAALSSRPMPDIYYPEASGIPPFRKVLATPTVSYLIASVILAPQPLTLLKECASDRASGGARALNCDLCLRLMLSVGDSFSIRANAAKMLSDRNALTYGDRELIRRNDWLYDQWTHQDAAADPTATLEATAQKIKDILESGSEIEGMQHYLQASNIPVLPPTDWIDKFAPKPDNPELKQDENHSPPVL